MPTILPRREALGTRPGTRTSKADPRWCVHWGGADLTCGLDVPDLGSMASPRVTPPARAFFRLSVTSVSSSSRLTRSASFCLHSSSSRLSLSSRTSWVFLPETPQMHGCCSHRRGRGVLRGRRSQVTPHRTRWNSLAQEALTWALSTKLKSSCAFKEPRPFLTTPLSRSWETDLEAGALESQRTQTEL